jgi:hypothetical protein
MKLARGIRAGERGRVGPRAAGRRLLDGESVAAVVVFLLEQARSLGVEGDVLGEVKRMAREATPYTHSKANLRHGRFIIKVEGNDVVWIGLADPPRGRRKTK